MDFKKGDIVVCLPGFSTLDKDEGGKIRGGAGYKDGKIFKIETISTNGTILWPAEIDQVSSSRMGIWIHAVRPAYATEIAWHSYDRVRGKDKNIMDMPSYDMKKYSVHYINNEGKKVKADVEHIDEIKDMQEFLYKFER